MHNSFVGHRRGARPTAGRKLSHIGQSAADGQRGKRVRLSEGGALPGRSALYAAGSVVPGAKRLPIVPVRPRPDEKTLPPLKRRWSRMASCTKNAVCTSAVIA